jgi:membrane protein YdbS with pleckstrin-like domain
MQNTIWQDKLEPGETIECEFTLGDSYLKKSLIMYTITGVLSLLIFIGFIMLPASLFYFLFYAKRANHYAFTNKRILILKGWLSTHLTSIDYEKITDIHIKQGYFEKRFYKTGSMLIETAGSASHLVLNHVEDPYGLKKELDTIRSRRIGHSVSNNSETSIKPQQSSNYKEIEELADLKDKGIISQHEFDTKKKQLLGL